MLCLAIGAQVVALGVKLVAEIAPEINRLRELFDLTDNGSSRNSCTDFQLQSTNSAVAMGD